MSSPNNLQETLQALENLFFRNTRPKQPELNISPAEHNESKPPRKSSKATPVDIPKGKSAAQYQSPPSSFSPPDSQEGKTKYTRDMHAAHTNNHAINAVAVARIEPPSPVKKVAKIDSGANVVRMLETINRPLSLNAFQKFDNSSTLIHYDPCKFLIHEESRTRNYRLSEFKLERILGTGGSSKVYQARRKSDGKIFAIKAMRRDVLIRRDQVSHVRNEKLMLELTRNSDFIMQYLSTFKDNTHIFMILQYSAGGDLFQYIKTHGAMQETNAKYYGAQILSAISYLHRNNILHRDIKPENVFLEINGMVRLGDLGYSKQIKENGTTYTFCGTPSYMAPEILKQRAYGYKADLWSFGCVMFQISSACSPFQCKHASDTFAQILATNIRWPSHEPFTPACKKLIENILVPSTTNRFSEKDIKSHAWFTDIDWDAMDSGRVSPPESVHQNIVTYALRHAFNDDFKANSLEISGNGESDFGSIDAFNGF